MHASLFDSNLFSLLTGHAHMPKEFSLGKVSKIKEGLGKTPYLNLFLITYCLNYVLTYLETL